jgi:hypothetical protein
LHGESLGSIDVGSPIFYRRIQVGQVTGFDLEEAGRGEMSMSVFVGAPYDQYVGKNTRGGTPAASMYGSIPVVSSSTRNRWRQCWWAASRSNR